MRITNQYLTGSMVRYLQDNLGRMASTQEKIATTKRINRPSDDPNVLSPLMNIKDNLKYNEQYDHNLDDGLAYMDLCDTTLGTVGGILTKAYEYAEQIANGTYSSDDRKAVAQQVDKLIDEVVEMGNSSLGSKYVFAGTDNGKPPFKRVTADDGKEYILFTGNTEGVMREVAAHSSYPINETAVGFDTPAPATPEGIFGKAKNGSEQTIYVNGQAITGQVIYADDPAISDDFSGVFKELYELRNALNDDTDPNQQSKIEESIDDLQKVSDKVLQHRVAVGSRYNQFADMKDQLLDQNIKLEETMSSLEDADIAKLTIIAAQQELAYQASLAIGANMLKTSLLDFLR